MKSYRFLNTLLLLFFMAFMFHACGGGSTDSVDSIIGGDNDGNNKNDSEFIKLLVNHRWNFNDIDNVTDGYLECIRKSDYVFFKSDNTGIICSKISDANVLPYNIDMGFTYQVLNDNVSLTLYNGYKISLKYHLGRLTDDKNNVDVTSENIKTTEKEWARENDMPHGMCGENVNWQYNIAKRILFIGGNGNMNSYGNLTERPWNKFVMYRVIIGEGVTSVGDFAFSGLSVPYVSLPKSMKTIGKEAFNGCNLNGYFIFNSDIEAFNDKSFANNPQLSINFADYKNSKTKLIGSSAFSNIGTVKDVYLPLSLTEIHAKAFDRTNVSSMHFNEGLKTIADSAFTKYQDREVVLPSSLTSLGRHSFIGDINSVWVGREILSLDRECIMTYENKGTLYIERKDPPRSDGPVIVDKWHKNLSASWILRVPAESVSKYESRHPWNLFQEIKGFDFEGSTVN